MPIDSDYFKDEKVVIRVSLVAVLLLFLLAHLFRDEPQPEYVEVSALEVWAYISRQAEKSDLDPLFVYARAWAESSLNPNAKSAVARGMMQLTRNVWIEVTDESYRFAWDWKTNIRVGIGYLAYCREYLKRNDSFSYPLLAASYRYGPYHVKKNGFLIENLKEPKNEIYKSIFEGDINPVDPPIVLGQ